MFTGIVQTTGQVVESTAVADGVRLVIRAELGSLQLGESICVSGVCLTACKLVDSGFVADVSRETCDRTTLGQLQVGARVNLERSLRVGDLLGGHILTGHVDARTRVLDLRQAGDCVAIDVALPKEIAPFVAYKGSVGLEGVSLTVNRVLEDRFELMLIPHTLEVTTLGEWKPGTVLNLEIDTIARYVARILETREGGAGLAP